MTPLRADHRCVGIVVHPTRDVSRPLDELRGWAERADVSLVQVPVDGMTRQLASPGAAEECELIVAIGGDGTMLAALRVGMRSDRPVLGVTSGSLGVLTRIAPGEVRAALQRFAEGDWRARELSALEVERGDGAPLLALNDIAIVRAGIGQIRVAVHVDGVLFGRLAGDGVVVATVAGSSAYTRAAGGPLLAAGTGGFVITPLPTHGGDVPPVVLGPGTRLSLDVDQGFGGARLEIDGQIADGAPGKLQITLRTGVARTVAFPDEEPLLSILRQRGIIVDSPRILAEDVRRQADGNSESPS